MVQSILIHHPSPTLTHLSAVFRICYNEAQTRLMGSTLYYIWAHCRLTDTLFKFYNLQEITFSVSELATYAISHPSLTMAQ